MIFQALLTILSFKELIPWVLKLNEDRHEPTYSCYLSHAGCAGDCGLTSSEFCLLEHLLQMMQHFATSSYS